MTQKYVKTVTLDFIVRINRIEKNYRLKYGGNRYGRTDDF